MFGLKNKTKGMKNPPETPQIISNFSAWLKLIILRENNANIIWWAILGFDSYANTCSFYFQSTWMPWSPDDCWPLAKVILKYFCRERVMMFFPLLQTWPESTPINNLPALMWCTSGPKCVCGVRQIQTQRSAHKGMSARSAVNPDLWWRACAVHTNSH